MMKKKNIFKLKSLFGNKSKAKRDAQQYSSQTPENLSPIPSPPATPTQECYKQFSVPPPSPPVPTQPVLPIATEAPAGPIALIPCMVCNRTFVPESLTKHIKTCEKIMKKRKTFDSSRQRREGTDLESFLPKNFGLPDNSPFLEKSPPPSSKPTKIKRETTRNNVAKAAPADLQKCPHCSRAFGSRAFERHVEWCADKAKLLPVSSTQPQVAEARQRLAVRTQYKAPPVRGARRSLTREKGSNSRSTSVESSRAASPPPPPGREPGDYRTLPARRTSESHSINDYDDHVPVIRGPRSSNSEHARVRQARLARDLSTNSAIPENKTNEILSDKVNANVELPNITLTNKITAKRKKTFELIDNLTVKYNAQTSKSVHNVGSRTNLFEKQTKAKKSISHIPIKTERLKMNSLPKINNIADTVESEPERNKLPQIRTATATKRREPIKKEEKLPIINYTDRSLTARSTNLEKCLRSRSTLSVQSRKSRKVSKKVKECVSRDSLDESDNINTDNAFQLENYCVSIPCVLHTNRNKKTLRANDKTSCDSDQLKETETFETSSELQFEEPLEILFKNPSMVQDPNFIIQIDIENPKYSIAIDIEELEETNSKDTFTELGIKENKQSICGDDDDADDILEEIENDITPKISTETYTKYTEQTVIGDTEAFMDTSNNTNIDNEYHEIEETEEIHYVDDFMETDSILNPYCSTYKKIDPMNTLKNRSNSFVTTNATIIDDDFPCDADVMITDNVSNTYSIEYEEIDNADDFMNTSDKILDNCISPKEDESIDYSRLHTPDTVSLLTDALDNEEVQYRTDLNQIRKSLDEIRNETNFEHYNRRITIDYEHVTIYELDELLRKPYSKKDNEIDCSKNIDSYVNGEQKYEMLCDMKKNNINFKTFIKEDYSESEALSTVSDFSSIKLPRIQRPADYDPFLSAALQMKQLMSSDTNIPKKSKSPPKDLNKTLPVLKNFKDRKTPLNMRSNIINTSKSTIESLTPKLQRMRSFGSTNSENSSLNTFGSRCSSFRLSRNEKKSSPKLNTTFSKYSKENVNKIDINNFSRDSSLNRSFSNNNSLKNRTPDKNTLSTSLYSNFQRNTNNTCKNKTISKDKYYDFVNLDVILGDDKSSISSSFIDPRLINENDNLPINVSNIINNSDLISSMESLLTADLNCKIDSFSSKGNVDSNVDTLNNNTELTEKLNKLNNKCNVKHHKTAVVDDLSDQYDKIMTSLEQSIASKTSIRDDESICQDFDIDEFISSFDDELNKQKQTHKRTISSTTRVVKSFDCSDNVKDSDSISARLEINGNDPIQFNKSISMNFSNTSSINGDSFFPSMKRSASLLDSYQKKSSKRDELGRNRLPEENHVNGDMMDTFKEFEKFYEDEKLNNWQNKNGGDYNKEGEPVKKESRRKEALQDDTGSIKNGKIINGKLCNDSAYSSLNRISPNSKTSMLNHKENANMSSSMEQRSLGSDSGTSNKENELRHTSSEEFLALERSTEMIEAAPPSFSRQGSNISSYDNKDVVTANKEDMKHSRSSTLRNSPSQNWRRRNELSSSSSESSLPPVNKYDSKQHTPSINSQKLQPHKMSKFCHECGSKFPEAAKFCIECGVKRLMV